MPLSTRQRFAR